jgi:hypothetical protein
MKKITSNNLSEILALLPANVKNAPVIFRSINTGFIFTVAACVDTVNGLEMHIGETAEKTGEVTFDGLCKLLERLQNSEAEIKIIWTHAGNQLVDDIFDVVYVTADEAFIESIMFNERPRELDIVFPEDAPYDPSGRIDEAFKNNGQVLIISF